MSSIHENLKTLRQSKGLSQTEIADAIHVTRQTVSSYETGRTQPDLETLKQLAELYQADLHDVLYGGNQLQRKIKLLKRATIVLSVILLLGLFFHTALLWAANTYFHIPSGTTLTESVEPIWNIRQNLMSAANLSANISRNLFWVGCLIIVYPLIVLNVPFKTRVIWFVCLIAAAYAIVYPFMLNDKIWGDGDYQFPLWRVLFPVLLVFVITLIADFVRYIKRKRKTTG